ncbi:MAG: lipid A export permease/ATP-binding protein MsbA [Thiobacillaceae bacterium]
MTPPTPFLSSQTSRILYLRLLTYVRPYWRRLAGALLGLAVAAATEPALSALFKPLLDGSFIQKDRTLIWLAPLTLIGLFFVRGVASYVSDYGMNWVGQRVVMDLREAMFAKLMSLPVSSLEDQTSGNIVANIAFNVSQVTQSATNVLTLLARDCLAIVGLIAWLLWINWRLTMIIVLVAPLTAWLIRNLSQRLRHLSRESQRNLGELASLLEDNLSGFKVVRIFGGQPQESRRFHHAADDARRFFVKRVSLAATYDPLIQLLAALAVAIIIAVAIWQATQDQTTVGGFVSYLVAVLMLFGPVKRLTSINDQLQRGLAAAEMIFGMLDEPGERDSGTRTLGRARGEIEFRKVGLRYVDTHRPALDGITLHVRPGETLALVGASGSGKTSLVNLLPRFRDPDEGDILLDGIPLAELKLQDLRAQIALVSQEVILFNDSLRANIAYGSQHDKTDDVIVAAARAAHAWEFIETLPQGLETEVGERGMKLSGGQRQRIAIARALLKDAPILILDEATSALDTESERHVQAALETLMQGRTTLVIAHRLSTIEQADRIVVLDQGKIVEQGSHAELLAKDGTYARLHRLQFREPTA